MSLNRFDKHSAAVLNACGYVCTHYEASWEDVGGPENGPKIVGGPAFDEWRLGNDYIIVCEGDVADFGTDQPMPEWDNDPRADGYNVEFLGAKPPKCGEDF